MSNLLPVKKQKGTLSRLFDLDSSFLFDRISEDFDRFFGTNCYADEDGNTVYQLEVPGFNKDNLKVDIADGVLTISGDRQVQTKNYAGQSRIFKRLSVGEIEDAEATVTDGILTLKLKYPKENQKQIEVK